MRILQVCPIFHPKMISGVGVHVLNLSKELLNMGHEVKVLSSNLLKEGSEKTVSDYEEVEGIETRRFSVFKLPGVASGYIPYPKLLGTILRSDADIIHAHSYAYFPTYVSALSRTLKRKVFVLTSHQPPTESAFRNRFLMRMYNRGIGRLSLKAADGIIAVTKLEAAYLIKAAGAEPHKITVVPEGIDLNLYYAKAGQSKESENILFVGRLATEKGLSFLIEAIPEVASQHSSATFLFVGEDHGVKHALLRQVADLKVSRYVKFLGPKFGAALADIYRESCLFVLPSIYETFGLVILEAMASGLPIVATRVGGVPELIREGYNGVLVPPKDHVALAEAINSLLSNRQLYRRMSAQNVETAKRYSWRRIAERIEALYVRLLDKNWKQSLSARAGSNHSE